MVQEAKKGTKPRSVEAAPEAETTEAAATGADAGAHVTPEDGAGAAAGAGHVCTVAFCPIGLALTAAERVQPDVVSHLLVAGREFFLAAKAVMDARADDLTGDAAAEGSPRMEHIDIG
jgi:hypothetical protein